MNDTETPSLCLKNGKDLNGKCFQKPVLSTTTEGYDKIRKFNKSGDITPAACIVYMWCGCVHYLTYIHLFTVNISTCCGLYTCLYRRWQENE